MLIVGTSSLPNNALLVQIQAWTTCSSMQCLYTVARGKHYCVRLRRKICIGPQPAETRLHKPNNDDVHNDAITSMSSRTSSFSVFAWRINHPDTSSSSHDLPCNNCCFSASGGRPFPRDARSKTPRTSTSQLIQVQQLIARSAIDDRRRCSANHPDTSSSSHDRPCSNCCLSASCGRPSRRDASSKVT